MANVKFLRGQSSALLVEGKEYQDGHLYMTDDTHKLYAGIKAAGAEKASLFRLNQDILFVDKVEDLTIETHKPEQFYYAKKENVLCIYDATLQKFVQVNPDQGAIAVSFEGAEDGNVLSAARYDSLNRSIVFTKSKLTAENIFTTRSFKVTNEVGTYTKGSTVDVKDIQSLVIDMLSKDVYPTRKTNPGFSVSVTGAGAKEVGTPFTPSFTVSGSDGKYTANGVEQSAGITYTYGDVTESVRPSGASETITGKTGTFKAFTVTENTNYTVTAKGSRTAGAIPKTYLESEYDADFSKDVRFPADSNLSATSSPAVTGFRSVFYGYKKGTDTLLDPANLSSDDIRGLMGSGKLQTGATTTKPTSMSTSKMQQMFFAFPKLNGSSGVTSMVIKGTNPPAPQTVKGPVTVNVTGANGYSAIEYDVFYVSNDTAQSGDDTFSITYN